MKGTSKPISSPGRTEKFPPPLMRFLRTNVGSRSRGRSRASPMFMRKKINNNNNNGVMETTQEPSSPKVTCIGQVRVKRSKKHHQKQKKQPKNKKNPCCCMCNNIHIKLHRPKSVFAVLKKWVVCFRFGYCRRKPTVESNQQVESPVSCTTTSTIENVTNLGTNNFPPKNALLLSRCRSAPYRSSSLASRFWGSPLNSTSFEETMDVISIKQENPVAEDVVLQKGENEGSEKRKSHEEEEMESSSSREDEENSNRRGGERGRYVHPLLLTRCKSEPATRGERLNPDSFLWMQRRSTETHDPQT